MSIEKDKVRLSFNNVSAGLKSTLNSPAKFMIAGEDHQFQPATAKITGNEIIVSSKAVKNPVAVRYCFDDASMPDVFGNNELPLAPFRTDKW
jgi:sialate O-acetylesterase